MSDGPAVVLHHVETTSSTNGLARKLAQEGAQHGTLVLADRQTAGRGRLGRVWVNESADGCLATLILRPSCTPNEAPLLCLAAAVAIQKVCGPPIGLKWPNDLLGPDGRKVGGVLAEMETREGSVDFVLMGFGVNLNSVPSAVPRAACLAEFGIVTDRTSFALACAAGVLAWSERIPAEMGALLTAWRAVDQTVGFAVRVGELFGIAEGLAEDGSLLVRDERGNLHPVRAGDVEMARRL